MADKKIGELPSISELKDTSLIPVEQDDVASKLTGAQFRAFAVEAASEEADRAKESADKAETWSAHPPYIGTNGNWWVYNNTTETFADSGIDASITISIADITMLDTTAKPYVTNTGTSTDPVFHLFLPKGAGIKSVDKISSSGLIDTYAITLTDGNVSTFTIQNGIGAVDTVNGIAPDNGNVTISGSDIVLNADSDTTVNNAVDPLYNARTVFGPIISFDDGIADAPVSDLTVQIEPVQDLHGYDHPWPGGGGKNLFDGDSVTERAIINSSGIITNSGGWVVSDYMPISGSYVTISAQEYNPAVYHAFYDADKNFISSFQQNSDGGNTTVSVPSGAAYLRCSVRSSGTNLQTFQAELGSTATAYEPYANICPITGWTGAKVTRTGKNLLDFDILAAAGFSAGSYSKSGYVYSGIVTGTPTVRFSPVDVDVVLSAQITSGDRNYPSLILINSNGEEVAKIFNGNYNIGRVSGKACTVKLAYNTKNVTENSTIAYPMVRLASETADTFEPYAGNTYDISFGEAGTVYGGTLDVVTGVLTVTWKMVTVGMINWSRNSSGGYFMTPILDDKKVDVLNVYSDTYKTFSSSLATMVPYTIRGHYQESSNRIYVKDERYSTVADFVAAEGDRQILYELATPLTYQLTPQQVTTLLGTNNISADCGDVTVRYRGDLTALYALNNAQQVELDTMEASVAPTEGSFYATRNYSIGEYLTIAGQLYKVTAAIANGGAITVGANVKATTVADELLTLFNAINS